MRLPWNSSWVGVGTHLLATSGGVVVGAVVLGQCQTDSWPAWIQAIGSIAAVAAVGLVYLFDRQNRKEAEARAAEWFWLRALPILADLSRKLSNYVLSFSDEEEALDVKNMDRDFDAPADALGLLLEAAPPLGDMERDLSLLAFDLAQLKHALSVVGDHQRGGLHHAWIRDRDHVLNLARRAARRSDDLISRVDDHFNPGH
jgi:hypothetical protein